VTALLALGLVIVAVWLAVVALALLGAPRGPVALLVGLLLGGSAVDARALATRDAVCAVGSIRPGGVGACIGVPGTGKTHVAGLASTWWPRVVIFDPYADKDASRVARGRSHRAAWEGERTTVGQLLDDPRPLLGSPLRLVVSGDPGDPSPESLARDFAALANLCWHAEDVALVAEECGLYGRSAVAAIHRIASGGAHAGMSLLLVCQGLGRIPIDGRKGITVISAGAQGAPEDVDDLAAVCGRPFANRVRALRGPDPGPADAPLVWRLGDGLREGVA
jgi:hypothetical protein